MDADGNSLAGKERRRHARTKVHVTIEIRTGAGAAPLRLSTDDISLGGCYVETMFTLDVGAKVEMTLWLNEQSIVTKAVVATKYPQLGNGFNFVDMPPGDLLKLEAFIQTITLEQKP